jgi:hypothetical protein
VQTYAGIRVGRAWSSAQLFLKEADYTKYNRDSARFVLEDTVCNIMKVFKAAMVQCCGPHPELINMQAETS